MKITNNVKAKIECDEKMLEILWIIYTNDIYVMQKWEYNNAEEAIITKGLALWNIFWGTMTRVPRLQVLEEMLLQWSDDMEGNQILDTIFWEYEKK